MQPLLHSTSDSMIRKLVVASDTAIDMEAAQVHKKTKLMFNFLRVVTAVSQSCKRNADLDLECIFVQVDECDDTDSNKTEVEEIEMVDMEGRAEVALFSCSVPLCSTKMK